MITPPLPTLPSRRRSRLWLWLTLGAVAASITIALPITIFYRVAHRFDKEYAPVSATLPAEMAAARKEGLPTTVEELRPKPPVKDAENAAPIYRRLTAIYQKQPKVQREADAAFLTPLFKKTSRTIQDQTAMRTFLTAHALELQIVEQVRDKPRCDFARDWSQGLEISFPEYPVMRSVARVLAVRALLRSDENQPAAALSDVALGARISRHVASDPTMIAALVSIAIEAIMHRQFVGILQSHGDNPALLPAARSTIEAFNEKVDLRHAFAGDLVQSCYTFAKIRRSPSFEEEMKSRGIRLPPSSNPEVKEQITDAWKSRMIAYSRRVRSSLVAADGDLAAFEKALQHIQQEEDANRFNPGYEMNAILVSVYLKIPSKCMQNGANRHIRNRLIALHQYHKEHGSFPESLAALPPAPENTDPFTNQPLKYRKTEKGFVLYSVSNNRKDDGGSEKPLKIDDSNWPEDIVVSYP